MPLSKIVAKSITDDTVTADQVSDNVFRAHKNMVINGAMEVHQRGGNVTVGDTYVVDRFPMGFVGGAVTGSHGTLSSSDSPYSEGFRKYLRLTNTTAASGSGDYRQTFQSLEGQNVATSGWDFTSSSSYVTLSFWVRVSVAGKYAFTAITNDGTPQEFAFTKTLVANTWTKVEKAIPGATNNQVDNDNGGGFTVYFRFSLGSNYTDSGRAEDTWQAYAAGTIAPDGLANWGGTTNATADLTAVQLELGDKATPFQHTAYVDELRRCQRYAWKLGGFGSDQYFGAPWLYHDGATIHQGPFFNPVQMSGSPSLTQYGTPIIKDNGTAISGFTFSIQGGGKDQCFSIQGQKSSHGLANDPLNCLNSPTTSDFFIISREV